MIIPKKLKLVGREINVVIDNKLCDTKEVFGMAQFKENRILLEDKWEGKLRDKAAVNITFLHEALHWIFYVMDRETERKDEKLIGELSELLYQVFKQIEGSR